MADSAVSPVKKDKEIKDRRGGLAFPAGEHHSAGQHRQDKARWFRDTGDSEPHVAALARGAEMLTRSDAGRPPELLFHEPPRSPRVRTPSGRGR